MRRLLPAGVAFCVMAGLLLGRFAEVVAPVNHLARPLVVVLGLTALVGAVCLFFPRHAALVAVAVGALLVAPALWGLLVASIVAGILLVERMTGRTWDLTQAVVVMTAVFLLGGVIRVAPMIPFGAVAHASGTAEDPPTYVVLLDGYPRIDTLADMGIDNSGFVKELGARGFVHDPDARTDHVTTFDTLTDMFGGEVTDEYDLNPTMQRIVRNEWKLPEGWATISSPAGHVTVPGFDLNSGGINYFEVGMLADSILGHLPGIGDLVMDGFRHRLNSDLETLASTDHSHVFAHLMAPHAPMIYGPDGQPLPPPDGRWPSRDIYSVGHPNVDGLKGTLEYLNGRLIEVVNRIIDREPDAVIVLFSDHGIRFSETPDPEWHRIFYAARTPGDVRPALAPATTPKH